MSIKILLERNDFRNQVFIRDNYKCIICEKKEILDAHHIIERRLFSDGGYYLDNGVTLCDDHHLLAEMTVLSCNELREKANIKRIILPDHLYSDEEYDKWGNIIVNEGKRIKGELFYDESVQKILKKGNELQLFSNYIKYPRTYHLPYSQSIYKDDRILENEDIFLNKNVIVTLKLDGENSSIYSDSFIHARSTESKMDKGRGWLKNYIVNKNIFDLPSNWRICGENLYFKHSIHYKNLNKIYFYVFSIWNDKNICLNWNETKEWCNLLNLEMVPVIYEGIYDKDRILNLFSDINKNTNHEGFVVRNSNEFNYCNFRINVAKFVNSNFSLANRHKFKYKRDELNI